MSNNTESLTLIPEFQRFANDLDHRLVTLSHDHYHTSRAVWNGRIDRRPAVVVNAVNAADVQLAVNFARDSGLRLAVRGQGHHVAGHSVCDDGVVVDLSAMKAITVDTDAQTARVEPGLTVGEFFGAIEEKGLIVTVGSHATVGLAGFTLGGGIGLLMGKYGLASDNLLSVDIVTADGQLRVASESENSDLFWAVRGGGSNFGIVTSLTYQLRPVEPVVGGVVIHPLPHFRGVLGMFREHAQDAPNELGLLAAAVTGPGGHPAAMLMAQHTGPVEVGERLMAPIKAYGPPLVDMIGPMPYGGLLHALDGQDPEGNHYAYTCRGIPELTDTVLDIIADFAVRRTSPGTAVVVYRQHGAVTERAFDATAYSGRHLPYMVGIYTGWEPGDDTLHLAWMDEFKASLAPYTVAPGCLSLVGEEGEDVVSENYGANYGRLREIKAKWDAENLFCNNHNIPPAR
ncbi:MAG TPA: FAD-binding oxidoreductase [Capsulimonadaceae bacterium]|jgi:hypothetical protein